MAKIANQTPTPVPAPSEPQVVTPSTPKDQVSSSDNSQAVRRYLRNHERLIQRRFGYSLMEWSDLWRQVFYAFVVGVITAAGSITFRWMIESVHHFCFEVLPAEVWLVPLIIAAGGLAVGILVHFCAHDARGHGVPEVINSVIMKGGIIKGRVALIKMVASALTIGSGGSAGREGPIVQIGAALASKFAQVLKLSEKNIILLVACGAAAGIASTFNAPLSGVFFALEIILGSFSARTFALVVLSSVTSAHITRVVLGNVCEFSAPPYSLVHSSEIGWYLILGAVCGLVGLSFTRSFYYVEDRFDALNIPIWVKPAVGGLIVGLIAIFYPQVMGNGYETINAAISGSLDMQLMTLLVIAKIIATSLTLGSGGAGGDLAPSLYIGAVLGGAFGCLIHALVPGVTGESGGYALVGMAAVFAACSRAPITAVLLIFELTSDYLIILPLMATTVTATLISAVLDRDSIYTFKLARKGLDFSERSDAFSDPMRELSVGEVMTLDYTTVPPNMRLEDLARRFNETGFHIFPVVDDKGIYSGIIAHKDLEYSRMRNPELSPDTPVSALINSDYGYVSPNDSIALALRTMGRYNVGRLPVLDSCASRHLVGLLRRCDIVEAYNAKTQIKKPAAHDIKVNSHHSEAEFIELQLPEKSPWNGKPVKDVPVPSGAVLVAVRRGGETMIPHGDTVLESGDIIVTFCLPQAEVETRRLLATL